MPTLCHLDDSYMSDLFQRYAFSFARNVQIVFEVLLHSCNVENVFRKFLNIQCKSSFSDLCFRSTPLEIYMMS